MVLSPQIPANTGISADYASPRLLAGHGIVSIFASTTRRSGPPRGPRSYASRVDGDDEVRTVDGKRYAPPMTDEPVTRPGGDGFVRVAAPPPGERYQYDVTMSHESGWELAFVLSIPSNETSGDLETSIVIRDHGPTSADIAYRERLYRLVGEVTVASGRIEAAMKRLLLVLGGGNGAFVDIDKTWTDLEKDLRSAIAAQAGRMDDVTVPLLAALDAALELNLKAIRDDIVHGYHWAFDIGQVLVSRFKRKSDPTRLSGSEDEITTRVPKMTQHAIELERIAMPHWHVAILPR